jgi:hypothetical protein
MIHSKEVCKFGIPCLKYRGIPLNVLFEILTNPAGFNINSDGSSEVQKEKIQMEFRTDGIPWTPYPYRI